jgi:cytochrome c oxidase subunit 2
MGLVMIAQAPAAFHQWWTHQLDAPVQTAASAGPSAFVMHCGGCHMVRGTDAAGVLGPDLSHLMQRTTIAAGTLPNTPAMLTHWITDPQAIKPGALMQAPELTGTDLAAIHAYLETLK